jgi:hypothetical protein
MSRRSVVITVSGEIDNRLQQEFEAFDEVEIAVGHGMTRLRAVGGDASALHGILHRIDALGLELLDVHQVDETADPDGASPT